MFGLFNKKAKVTAPATPDPNDPVERAGIDVEHSQRSDGVWVIHGDVDISQRSLSELPDLSSVEVEGGFYCAGNHLTSLKGAPKKVGGTFNCSHNRLTSLEHGPAEVGGLYNCEENFLTNLKGAPREALSFDCSNNTLSSLEGAPEKVTSTFLCVNTAVPSLKGAPREIADDCVVTKANLLDLSDAPETFGHLLTDFGNFATAADIPVELRERRILVPAPSPKDAAAVTLAAPIHVHRPLSLKKKP
jgi:hypothetical protein